MVHYSCCDGVLRKNNSGITLPSGYLEEDYLHFVIIFGGNSYQEDFFWSKDWRMNILRSPVSWDQDDLPDIGILPIIELEHHLHSHMFNTE